MKYGEGLRQSYWERSATEAERIRLQAFIGKMEAASAALGPEPRVIDLTKPEDAQTFLNVFRLAARFAPPEVTS